jgi:hypothetical protein
LLGSNEEPEYKREGFFVFSDLRDGNYTLRITGERFQPATIDVVTPVQVANSNRAPLIDSRGDDELIVIVQTIDELPGNNGGRRITFDPVVLTKQIRAGSPVVSDGLSPDSSATLILPLELGSIFEARLDSAEGLEAGDIVRVIRDKSIRLTFHPYYSFATPITRIVGKVSQADFNIPLAGARVRITGMNDSEVTQTDVQGVAVFTGIDTNDNRIVLGSERDISVVTNEKGDYNFYFSNETLASFRITDQTLEELEAANVPEAVRDDLEAALIDRVFRGFERFLLALRETIGNANTIRYQELIVRHSENFIRNLTLEVNLAGFQPASKLETLSSAKRKVVDFELTRN